MYCSRNGGPSGAVGREDKRTNFLVGDSLCLESISRLTRLDSSRPQKGFLIMTTASQVESWSGILQRANE